LVFPFNSIQVKRENSLEVVETWAINQNNEMKAFHVFCFKKTLGEIFQIRDFSSKPPKSFNFFFQSTFTPKKKGKEEKE